MEKENKVKLFNKKWWGLYWKNVVINLAIFFAIFISFTLIDLLTKLYIFKWEGETPPYVEGISKPTATWCNFVIWKSVAHDGTTVGWIKSLTLLHIISFVIILAGIFFSFYLKDKAYRGVVVFLAIVAAGAFGNMYDRMAYGPVRDIIYLPWAPYGTFNFADVWLAGGAGACGLTVLITMLVLWLKNKKNKNSKAEAVELKEQGVAFDSSKTNDLPQDPNHSF
ncbi:signal peptidase II [[Mycoplasma] falconis]|uniref:Signal peptidase II n=1 Tax=[Mycoplasma] falconis TaxID=92403 RepID=A0A501XCE5_9BACT|nr:signal peptidase II [[Mycoplasma] falconis]TPE58027.1 signal peptidase II [[Mycoplasma] falconis]